jgi:hypothetical protein
MPCIISRTSAFFWLSASTKSCSSVCFFHKLYACFNCFFFSFVVALAGGKLWRLQRFLQCIKYIILEYTPFLEWFQRVSLLHLRTCVHIFCTAFTLLPPFPTTSLPQLVPTLSPGRTCSAVLFSKFGEQKKIKGIWHFLLVWDNGNYTGSFLVIFPSIFVLYPQLVYVF